MALSIVVTTVLALLVLLVIRLRNVGQRPGQYPPGPPTIPVLGNIHLMPAANIHGQFQRWAEQYGPIYSLILGTKPSIVLSSPQAVKELLDRRSAIYSSRPEMYMSRLMSGDSRMVLMRYDDTWRTARRIVHSSLSITASRAYLPYQDLESRRLLLDLLEAPASFSGHLHRYTNSLITQIVYGFRTPTKDDPRLKQLISGFEEFCTVSVAPVANLLDVFPILRYLPDAVWPLRKYAKQLVETEKEFYLGLYLEARDKIRNGTAQPCFCVDLVKAQQDEELNDLIAAYTAGTLIEAGTDTTASTLVGFVRAMVCFPDVARMAQAELDRVCGDDRMPQMDDLARLPYIRGCMKESLRTMPAVILGIPHAVIKDDSYEGYEIPKDAAVFCNIWTLNHDPERYAHPDIFDPTRWEGDLQTSAEATSNPDVGKRDHFAFGAGRRVCQGMHIADRSLFLAISWLLWAFDFLPAVDEATGEVAMPRFDDNTDGLASWPKPFQANIKPRDTAKAAAVRRAWEETRELLDDKAQWRMVPEGTRWKQ